MYLKVTVLKEDGISTANIRLQYAKHQPFYSRYLVILSKKNLGEKVNCYHKKGNHFAGTNHTLFLLPIKFWLFQGREEVKECEKRVINGEERSSNQ